MSVSMDGPNVNFKLLELLQLDHAENYGGAQLVSVGSCGLHTLHNAFKAGFSMWHVDKIFKAMHTLFHHVPARREDYVKDTKSSVFPQPFCGHRWLENLPVIERALAVWPSLKLYLDAVHKKELPNPKTASFDTIEAAHNDPLTITRMHFVMTVARTFDLFMRRYQTDEPVMPFFGKDLAELIKVIIYSTLVVSLVGINLSAYIVFVYSSLANAFIESKLIKVFVTLLGLHVKYLGPVSSRASEC